jgi:hypothetical protein
MLHFSDFKFLVLFSNFLNILSIFYFSPPPKSASTNFNTRKY